MKQSSLGFTKNILGIKGIIIIIALSISYQIYIDNFVDLEEFSFADVSYGITSFAVGIVSLIVAKRYKGSPVFGKSYFALGIGFIIIFAGDLIYNYYSLVLEEDPYPSLADAFFLGFYVFAGYHLVKNIKYFKKNLSVTSKLGVPLIALLLIVGFGLFTIETLNDDPTVYFMGILYVSASAAILSLAIFGATIFRNSVLGMAWFMLVIGIFIYSFTDVWYYYIEELGEYTVIHPVNTLWLIAYMFMIYALYKHKKII